MSSWQDEFETYAINKDIADKNWPERVSVRFIRWHNKDSGEFTVLSSETKKQGVLVVDYKWKDYIVERETNGQTDYEIEIYDNQGR